MPLQYDLQLIDTGIKPISEAGKAYLSGSAPVDLLCDANNDEMRWLFLLYCDASSEDLRVEILSDEVDQYINQQLGED